MPRTKNRQEPVEIFDAYRPDFQAHYYNKIARPGYGYETYELAYRYGYRLATDEDHQKDSWDEITPEVRRYWAENYESNPDRVWTWEQFNNIVHYVWHRLRDSKQKPATSGFQAFEIDFRRHHEVTYANLNNPFRDYKPAYQYGYDLAADEQFGSRSWEEIEPEARQQWETEHTGRWDKYKDAIRYGWHRRQAYT